MSTTIVAIATGVTTSGISIVRVSGEKAVEISNKCLKKLDLTNSYIFYLY